MRTAVVASSPRAAASIAAAYLSGGQSGCVGDRVDLFDLSGGGGERPGVDVERGEVVERVGEEVKRAGLSRDADAAGCEHVPELVVPEILCEAAREP